MQISGQVEAIRAYNTSFGEMYNVVVNGERIGVGKYPPRDVKVGDWVTVEYETKGNFKNAVKGGVRKDSAPAEAPREVASQVGSAPARRQGGSFNVADARQTTISRQAALNTALTYVKWVGEHGALEFPKTTKTADKLGLLDNFFLQTAQRFFKLSTGDDWSDLEDTDSGVPEFTNKPVSAGSSKRVAVNPDSGVDEFDDELPPL